MCGIAGALAFIRGSFTVDAPYINRMRDTMPHRGPDGSGTWVASDGAVGLGHRRLAIIDLSTQASQPMANEDGSLRIVFNGEIYNHAEVRAELERIGGHVWRTNHSDTEVILHAYEQWGVECLHRFRGMFAFALWDANAKRLWLVRDRIGIKPLYYAVRDDRVVFASEIKALLADPDQPRAVNEEAFYHYLTFITTPAPDTLFSGIRKLAPGTWLSVEINGTLKEQRYWDVWDHVTPQRDVPDSELSERLLDELRTAVRYRKVSDVPVGVFLSGGIDSSTNAALFAEGGDTVKTFSIGYDRDYDTYKNELSYARLMASHVGAEHHERILTMDDLLAFLPRMIHLQDEPIGDPVCVPVYYVSKLARDHGVIVCQVGEGADELFWGYESWKLKLALQQYGNLPVPRSLKRAGLAALELGGKHRGHPYEALRRNVLGQPVFWGGVDAFTEFEKQHILSPRLRKDLEGLTSWEALRPIRERFEAKAWDQSPLNWMTYVDLSLRLPELLLMRVDKMSMGVSLEGRVPFLDHRFVEFAMSVPAAVKTRGGELKYLLKRAVRGVIPDEIIDRKKQGFGVPVYEWFLGRLGTAAEKELEWFCRESDLMDFAYVRQLMRERRGGQLWYLLNVALWWRIYIAQEEHGLDEALSLGNGTREPLSTAAVAG